MLRGPRRFKGRKGAGVPRCSRGRRGETPSGKRPTSFAATLCVLLLAIARADPAPQGADPGAGLSADGKVLSGLRISTRCFRLDDPANRKITLEGPGIGELARRGELRVRVASEEVYPVTHAPDRIQVGVPEGLEPGWVSLTARIGSDSRTWGESVWAAGTPVYFPKEVRPGRKFLLLVPGKPESARLSVTGMWGRKLEVEPYDSPSAVLVRAPAPPWPDVPQFSVYADGEDGQVYLGSIELDPADGTPPGPEGGTAPLQPPAQPLPPNGSGTVGLPPPARDPKAGLERIMREKSRGTVRIADRDYRLVFVPARSDYAIGLTREQAQDQALLRDNYVQASRPPNDPILVKLREPYLILDTEVTNWQYLSYLKDRVAPPERVPGSLNGYALGEVPEDLRRLPVTGVNYYEAAAFADWLGEKLRRTAPDWTIRLPCEFEWEFAARGDGRRWVVPDQKKDALLERLRTSALLPVGSNELDVSWCGVHDLCGNVAEWTASVFDPELYMKMEIQGQGRIWDPTDPYAAGDLFLRPPESPPRPDIRLVVRGGAAGFGTARMQVSVRVPWMSATSLDKLGFRVVFVPGRAR